MPRFTSQPKSLPLAEAQAALTSPPPGFTYPLHLKLTLADAARVARLKNAVPNARGDPQRRPRGTSRRHHRVMRHG